MDLKQEFENYMQKEWGYSRELTPSLFNITSTFHNHKLGHIEYTDFMMELYWQMFQKLYPEINQAYQMLSMYGVSKKRARDIANGIDVLMTRLRKANIDTSKPMIPMDISFGEVDISIILEPNGNKLDYNIKATYVVSGNKVIGFSIFNIFVEDKIFTFDDSPLIHQELLELALIVAKHDNERNLIQCS